MTTTRLAPIRVCRSPPKDKRKFAKRIGDDLLKRRGKRKFYSIADVRSAMRRQNLPVDVDCWAYSLFTSRSDFDRHHRLTGESCDYDAMRGDMIDALADGHLWLPVDIDLSWLEWPDIDLSSLFDFFDIG